MNGECIANIGDIVANYVPNSPRNFNFEGFLYAIDVFVVAVECGGFRIHIVNRIGYANA